MALFGMIGLNMKTILKTIFSGLYELCKDSNAWFVLICLAVMSFLALHKVIGDVSFAAFWAVLPAVYCYTAHKYDMAQLAVANPQPIQPAPPIVQIDTGIEKGNP